MRNEVVLAFLPKAGLANKLLVWAEALVYAKENDLDFFVIGWRDIKIGPYLRNERKKRNYAFFFKNLNRPNIFYLLIFLIFYKKTLPFYGNKIKHKNSRRRILYFFNKVPNWDDYFYNLRNNEEFVRKSFYNMLSPKYQRIFNNDESPVIGVHIRCSDFVNNKELFGLSPNIRTPISYFIDVIKKIRTGVNKNLKVTVFSDGRYSDISEIFSLKNVYFSESSSDLEDLIKLSKSKIIIASYSSTFSYWAGYLSKAPVILHPYHNIQIRKKKKGLFEGKLDLNKTLDNSLLNYLKKF
tara:strand:+ start:23803 stop:24690 length:888 start_codon:yes stop_codon:yes gene_type:complete